MAELVSLEMSLLNSQMAAFSLCPPMVILLCVGHLPGIYSSYKAANPIGLGSILMTSFNLNYLFEDNLN